MRMPRINVRGSPLKTLVLPETCRAMDCLWGPTTEILIRLRPPYASTTTILYAFRTELLEILTNLCRWLWIRHAAAFDAKCRTGPTWYSTISSVWTMSGRKPYFQPSHARIARQQIWERRCGVTAAHVLRKLLTPTKKRIARVSSLF